MIPFGRPDDRAIETTPDGLQQIADDNGVGTQIVGAWEYAIVRLPHEERVQVYCARADQAAAS